MKVSPLALALLQAQTQQGVGPLSITGGVSVRSQALPIVPVALQPQPRNRRDRRRLAHAKR